MIARIAAEASLISLSLVWIYMILDQSQRFYEIPEKKLHNALVFEAVLIAGGIFATIFASTLLPKRIQDLSRLEQDCGVLIGISLLPMVLMSRTLFEWAQTAIFSDYIYSHAWISMVLGSISLIRMLSRTPWKLSNSFIDIIAVQVALYLFSLDQVVSPIALHLAVFTYQLLLHYGQVGLACSFTYGEAMLLAQGISFLLVDAILFTLQEMGYMLWFPIPSRDGISILLQVGLICSLVLPALCTPLLQMYGTSTPRIVRPSLPFAPTVVFLGILLLVALVFIGWTSFLLPTSLPLWVYKNLLVPSKLLVLAYWLVLLCIFVPVVPIITNRFQLRQIVARKLYHFLAVALFLPVTLYEPDMMRLAYGVAVAVFLVVECIRAMAVPPFGRLIAQYIQLYLDHRDEGRLVLSHTYLLLGCALPLWLVGSDLPSSFLVSCAGILALGIGDAMGAVVGSSIGTVKVVGSKTLEGSVAVFLSILLVSLVCHEYHLDLLDGRAAPAIGFVVSTLLTTAMEAVTCQIDNLVLPLFYSAMCCLTASL